MLALLTGCAAHPSPSPTPSPRFTSEADAYKAAEDTYRAYVDALNRVRLEDPATFESLYRLETADALDTDKEAFSAMHADGWRMTGRTVVTLLQPSTTRTPGSRMTYLDACVDVSNVELVDAHGNSMVDSDRGDVQQVVVAFTRSDTSPTGWLISSVDGRTEGPTCDS
ncbi:hypothetical protein [Microbacterium luticocti]|uniref:hypothetical protein n=1 Tax=Microbacterium luticocti TaxID=451764 RepID=UPI0012EC60F1|nr:hypothetical protein [Microbacterium luticocti]